MINNDYFIQSGNVRNILNKWDAKQEQHLNIFIADDYIIRDYSGECGNT